MPIGTRTTATLHRRAAAAAVFLVLFGCGKPQPMGDQNAIIIGVPDEGWTAIGQDVYDVLEPTAFGLPDERIFRVTQVDPQGPFWADTRRFRTVVVVGEPADEWIAEALGSVRQQPSALPAMVETRNVWARGQRVYALVVPPAANARAVSPLLADVGASMLEEYHEVVRQRMFVSGVDTARISAPQREGGFRLIVPRDYRMDRFDDSTVRFINELPDPSRRQRSVLVMQALSNDQYDSEGGLLGWRDAVAGRYYEPGQVTLRERVESVEFAATDGVGRISQVQGTWSSEPGAWPAGGPFITRTVPCPDGRTFLLDAWVYAPGREKYEYMFQLNTILDSFSCAAPGER